MCLCIEFSNMKINMHKQLVYFILLIYCPKKSLIIGPVEFVTEIRLLKGKDNILT